MDVCWAMAEPACILNNAMMKDTGILTIQPYYRADAKIHAAIKHLNADNHHKQIVFCGVHILKRFNPRWPDSFKFKMHSH